MNISLFRQDLPIFGVDARAEGEVMGRMVSASSFPKVTNMANGHVLSAKNKKKNYLFKAKKEEKSVAAKTKQQRGRVKKWTKPEGKPNRPLSAYNFFFRHQRAIMLGPDAPSQAVEKLKKRVHCKTHGKIGFAEMAKTIAGKWKALDAESKEIYEKQAQMDKRRYELELDAWRRGSRFDHESGGRASPLISSPSLEDIAKAEKMIALNRVMMQLRPATVAVPDGCLSLDYLRCIEEQRQAPTLNFPAAADVSTEAILLQFQGMQQQQQQQRRLSAQQDDLLWATASRDLDRVEQLARINPQLAAAEMRRLEQRYQYYANSREVC